MSKQTNLRIPQVLRAKLDRDAKRQKVTIQAVITDICAKYYQIEVALPERGRRTN